MSILRELRDFAVRGTAVDLAVGVIVGGAFGKLIGVLVATILVPIIGLLTGGVDFPQRKVLAMSYGEFLNTVIQFGIIASCLFAVIKGMNKLKRQESVAASAALPVQEVLLREIRDLLKQRARQGPKK